MNRNQLTQTGITVVIVVLFYQFILSIIRLVYTLLLSSLNQTTGSIIIGMLLPVILYLAAIYLLAMYRKPIARWINRKEVVEQTQIITISSTSVLHISLIILCFITIINEVPAVIYWTVEILRHQEAYTGLDDGFIDEPEADYYYWEPIMKIVFALLVLIFSKRIAGIWYKKKSAE